MALALHQVVAAAGACVSSSFCPRPSPVACSSRTSGLKLKCALPLKHSSNANEFGVQRRRELKSEEWRRGVVKATGADSDGSLEVEVMDPETGEYRGISGEINKPRDSKIIEEDEEDEEELEDEFDDGESEEELLKRFAAAVGIEDEEVVGKLFNKMRNPASDKIVKQLEEGVGDVEDLLMDMFGNSAEFKQLFNEVEKMIDTGDEQSAREVVEGNYEALLEQLEEGNIGVEQAAMLDILAHLYMRLGDTDSAEQLLEQTKELLDNIPENEAVAGNILEHLGSMYLKLGKPRKALPLFEKSLALKELQGDDIPSLVRTMLGLANAYSELNMGTKSTEVYQQILSYAEEALGTDDEDLAAPLMHLGSSLLEEGKLDEAELTIQRALALTEKTYGEADGRYGVAACVLAQVKSSQGQFDAAVDWFKKGLQVIESLPDFSEDENIETVRLDLAALLCVLGRDEEKNHLLLKADMKDRKLLEYYSSQQVEHLEKLAEQYAEAGELQKSEAALRRSLQLLAANIGPDAPQVSVVLQLLSALLNAQPDRQTEAESLARECLRIREKAYGKYHISVGEACSYLASLLHDDDRDEEAVDLMYRVVDIQEREYGPDNPDLEETLDVLSMLLMNTSRYSETIPIVRKLERVKANNPSSG